MSENAPGHSRTVSRRAFILSAAAGGGIASIGSGFIPELFQPGENLSRNVLQGMATLGMEREKVISLFQDLGIKISDTLPVKAKNDNKYRFIGCPWENKRLAAFTSALKLLPSSWWTDLKEDGGVTCFLFSNHILSGRVYYNKPYAVGFWKSVMDPTPVGRYAAILCIAHEAAHLLTLRSDDVRSYWGGFLTSEEGLNLKIDKDGSIMFKDGAWSYARFGNTSMAEFIAVSSSLYATGKNGFKNVYSAFLSEEQIEMLYEKIKLDIYKGREYKTDFLAMQVAKQAREYPELFAEFQSFLSKIMTFVETR